MDAELLAGQVIDLLEIDPRTISDSRWDRLCVLLGAEPLSVDQAARKEYHRAYKARRRELLRAKRAQAAVTQSVTQAALPDAPNRPPSAQ